MNRDTKEPEIYQEEDVVRTRTVLWIAIVAGIIGILSVVWSGWLLDRQMAELREGAASGRRAEPERAPRAIGILQTLIEKERRGQRLKAEQRAILDAYGWVDRERGLVRIPIERAIDLVAVEEGP